MSNERIKIRVSVNEDERFTKKASRLRQTTANFLLTRGVPEKLLEKTPYSIMTFGEKSWLEGVVFVGYTGIKHGEIEDSSGQIKMTYSTDQDHIEDVVERKLSFDTAIGLGSTFHLLPARTTFKNSGGTSAGSENTLVYSYISNKPNTREFTNKKGVLIVFSNKVVDQLSKKKIVLGRQFGLITKTEPKK